MEMNGEQRIPASREVVWAALNDPDILKACIPGCQQLIKSSETNMTAMAIIKVGPVSAKFQGAVTLSDLDPPNGYRITGEGQGGVAGFAKGSAVVHLEEQDGATLLRYQVSADIGGKLAQLGGRLIDATARKMSDAFFKKFSEELQRRESAGNMSAASPSSDTSKSTPQPRDDTRSRSPAATDRSSASPKPAQPDRLTHLLLAAILIGIAALGVFFTTGRTSMASGTSPAIPFEFTASVLLLIVTAVGYLLGRTSGFRSPSTVQLDTESFRALLQSRHAND
ncbi:SRPBCC family protein [Tardiphaga sp. 367_B4_N1_1]|uniref:SRPBCC family protein n=1 Tax=Tardiphaga sp. 367_B4_N1_1 TaxID=3240777 RepID=UPI003F26361E